MKNDSLKISVVTVCYNAVATIEETILSVLNQTYPDIEYIIIDGGSTDGTVDIIKKYSDHISYWVSEPDKGIYDAMNKGIKAANGDYINFMNAGDLLFDNETIHNITKALKQGNINVLYGKTMIKYSFGTYIVTPDNPERLRYEMGLCHQSVVISLDTMRRFPYDISLRISGDHKSLLSMYLDNPKRFLEYDGIIARYNAVDGVSSTNVSLGYKEGKSVTQKKDSFLRRIRIYLRSFLPANILKPICRIYFKFNHRYQRIGE